MTGAFSSEQTALRDTVRSVLAKRSDVRSAIESERGYDEQLWAVLAEQVGAASVGIPEQFGGAGYGPIETQVVLEELGYHGVPSPMLGSAVLAAQALLASGDAEACERLLPSIADGSRIAALCWAGACWSTTDLAVTATDGRLTGVTEYVLDGAYADVLVVAASIDGVPGLFEVDPGAEGVTRRVTPTMDPTRRLSIVEFDGATGIRLGSNSAVLETIRTAAIVALSAEQVGGAARCLDMTVEYSKSRVQFGRPIGSFQALKHRMADMYVLLESAKSASYQAAWALAGGLESAHSDAVVAKVHCSEAYSAIAAETIQLHGGIAITWEHDAQLYFKRAQASAQLFGQPREYALRARASLSPARHA